MSLIFFFSNEYVINLQHTFVGINYFISLLHGKLINKDMGHPFNIWSFPRTLTAVAEHFAVELSLPFVAT